MPTGKHLVARNIIIVSRFLGQLVDSDQRFNPTTWPRGRKRLIVMASDGVLLLFSAWFAYDIRFNMIVVPTKPQLFLMLAAPALSLPVFLRLGIYRSVMKFIDDRALQVGTLAMGVSSLIWAVAAFLTEQTGGDGLPRSVPAIYFILGTVLVGTSRVSARWLSRKLAFPRRTARNALIVGTGDAGRQLAASLRESDELEVVAFIDHDERFHGSLISGLPVFAPGHLSSLIESREVRDVIVAWPSVPSAHRAEILAALRHEPVRVRSLPALASIASGRHLVNLVREIDLVDVLGRSPIPPRPELLKRNTSGKTVLVTGAGGSIGSEMCRQVALLEPNCLVILEANEHVLYNIQREISALTRCEVVAYLGSVLDQQLIERIIRQHGVETIYHAAAHKHVPIVEGNVLEGIRNNVFGTNVLAQAAYRAGVEAFTLISTDKAVRPTNVMGATKRWAELIVQGLAARAAAERRNTRFCAVRFGNVLGSSGSVVPLFKEQIAHGGPVTVTHPEMTRYFMSIEEAVGLVIQAGALSNGGELFLLDMGEPVRILDLARNMIKLTGQTFRDTDHPDGEIEIRIVGTRPGEKITEELLISNDNVGRTSHEKIIVAIEPRLDVGVLSGHISSLYSLVQSEDASAARRLLLDIALGPTMDTDCPTPVPAR
jgi:FlaA1/EpsC-like NDP-sugar epimerase